MILSDEKLRATVRSFLHACGYTEVRHGIDIDAHDGVVVLTGWVAEAIDVRVIGTLLNRLEGVMAVKNLLRPRPSGAGSVGSQTPTVSAGQAGRLTVGMR